MPEIDTFEFTFNSDTISSWVNPLTGVTTYRYTTPDAGVTTSEVVSTTPSSHSLTDAVGASELNDMLKALDKIRIKQGVSFKKCKSFMNIE